MLRRVLVFVFLALLGGCASLPKDTAFEVQEKSVEASRQEPWQNMAISRKAVTQTGVAVTIVKLPEPMPLVWAEELVDTARIYEVREGEKHYRKPLERVVFRAVSYLGEAVHGLYDAVLNKAANRFFVLIPPHEMDGAKYTNLLVATSDGRYVFTTRGKTVELPEGTLLTKLPEGFFRHYPSPMGPIVRMVGWDKYGEAFLTELTQQFPLAFTLRGEAYLGRPDVVEVAGRFTSLNTAADKLLSCTSFRFGPEDLSGGPALAVKGAIFIGQAVYAVSREDCLK